MGIDFFERVARASGRFLRAERVARGAGDRTLGEGLLLTFDVGRLWVRVGDGEGLTVSPLPVEESLPGGLSSLDEEEPWWRVLGSPLSDAGWASSGALRLRFHTAGDAGRWLRLEVRDSDVRACLEGS